MHAVAGALFVIVAVPFALKMLWNAGVVYALAWEVYSQRKESAATTLCPHLDVALLVLGCIAAALTDHGLRGGLYVAGYGALLIVASYLLFAVGAVLSGSFIRYVLGYRGPDERP